VSGDQYANKLEQWFHSLPGLVQETLHEPFTWTNDALKSVAGHPEALRAAGQQYVQVADAVHQLGQQQLQHRTALAGHWRGDAYDAFTGKLQHVEAQLDKLAEATRHVKDLLESGAKACVDGANMIVDIVTSLIMLALGTIAVNMALALVTAGTTLAAGVAEVIAEAAAAAARVARVVEKVAEVLTKLAEVFRKVQALLERITEALKAIQETLKDAAVMAKTSRGWDKVGAKVSFGIQKTVVSKGISLATGGTINIPGSAGGFYHGGREYVDGRHDASDAQNDAQK
jgi:uncharacterized protein YukE